MKNTFPLGIILVAGTTRLELVHGKTEWKIVRNAKNDVAKKKPADFTFIQIINGALCILHVKILVTLKLWDQRSGN